MPVELNPLESARFGVVAARVRDPDASPLALNSAAQALAVQMLTVRLDSGDHGRIHALEADGFRLMDSIVYYERSLNAPPPSLPVSSNVAIRRAEKRDATAVAEVARAAFSNYIGHYHSDARLEPTAADAAYVEWAESSVVRPSDDCQAILLFCGDRLSGFLIARSNSKAEMEIVLNAVHPHFQRRGFYQQLLAEALSEGFISGVTRVTISTQVNNFPVQRAWAKLGFRPYRCLHTFHKWYD